MNIILQNYFVRNIFRSAYCTVSYIIYFSCRLPPDEDSLRWKIKRANYQAYLMRNQTHREHPDAVGNGWELVNGVCKPVRYSKPPLPQHLNQQDMDVETMDLDGEDNGMEEENSDLDVDESDNETLSVLSEGELEYEDVNIGSDDGSSDEDY